MKKSIVKWSYGIAGVVAILLSFCIIQNVEAKPKHPLVGVWTLEYQKEGRPVVCYKLLKKNGRYVNLKSTDWDAKHFVVTRHGKFTLGAGEYVEHLMEEHGRKCKPVVDFPLNYQFLSPDTVKISYQMCGQEYNEVWKRAEKAPIY